MKVVITGTSRGIGAGLARAYAARGDEVVGTSRQGPHALDVTSPESQRAFAAGLGSAPVDLLVCNAGVYLDKGHRLETGYAADLWAESFATNVTGVFLTIQSLLPQLRAARSARIAILSSQMASHERAPGGSYIYRASKAAVLNLGRNLASDLRGEGIAVGIYHPGWVETDMGGPGADIPVAEAVAGLTRRFDELSLADSGVFKTWDGRVHPY
ncbi:SDR family NAD(P)-dependent oxidoreductase [Roseobacter sp. YSTF-M11]|uniref:SDR family NAD(P)-dependent oxidoreductase n=1 Tax=Roseobacter insulae TaxID=2859783 RepID=A0A9X1FU29_9RHOB|nr:SDR family NAD(P)-dependent oxidoreductase [Roseobacter insulae]MBW4707688.1 SDR family NAD(P)-dependent oxidoreductase [Roseobacter insulae]